MTYEFDKMIFGYTVEYHCSAFFYTLKGTVDIDHEIIDCRGLEMSVNSYSLLLSMPELDSPHAQLRKFLRALMEWAQRCDRGLYAYMRDDDAFSTIINSPDTL